MGICVFQENASKTHTKMCLTCLALSDISCGFCCRTHLALSDISCVSWSFVSDTSIAADTSGYAGHI